MLRTGGTKMILTVDIGNTTMTMGLYTPEGVLQFRGSVKTDKNKTRIRLPLTCWTCSSCIRRTFGM